MSQPQSETARSGSTHIAGAEQLLEERGLSLGRVRVAVGRSGIAVGFPRDPMVHVSWWALAVIVLAVRLLRRR